jgi:hypothetical protein
MIPRTFWHDVEKVLKYVLYSDTDSLFIHIPSINSEDKETCISKCNKVANEINETISTYLNTLILPKLHVDPEHNFTEFKTEFTCNSIMFLDIKKNYAYSMTSKEGKIFDNPDIQYTGIPIVKSNTSEFSRELLVDLIEKIVLNKDLEFKQFSGKLMDLAKEKHEYLMTQLVAGNFKYFGTPVRWSSSDYAKEPAQVIGMRLYNTITKTETFKPLSSGLQIPIEIKNNSIKIKEIELGDEYYITKNHYGALNFICVPYNYDSDECLKLFKEYDISIINNLWERLTDGSIIQKIVNLIKDYGRK